MVVYLGSLKRQRPPLAERMLCRHEKKSVHRQFIGRGDWDNETLHIVSCKQKQTNCLQMRAKQDGTSFDEGARAQGEFSRLLDELIGREELEMLPNEVTGATVGDGLFDEVDGDEEDEDTEKKDEEPKTEDKEDSKKEKSKKDDREDSKKDSKKEVKKAEPKEDNEKKEDEKKETPKPDEEKKSGKSGKSGKSKAPPVAAEPPKSVCKQKSGKSASQKVHQ